jgi:hypothetical protein
MHAYERTDGWTCGQNEMNRRSAGVRKCQKWCNIKWSFMKHCQFPLYLWKSLLVFEKERRKQNTVYWNDIFKKCQRMCTHSDRTNDDDIGVRNMFMYVERKLCTFTDRTSDERLSKSILNYCSRGRRGIVDHISDWTKAEPAAKPILRRKKE